MPGVGHQFKATKHPLENSRPGPACLRIRRRRRYFSRYRFLFFQLELMLRSNSVWAAGLTLQITSLIPLSHCQRRSHAAPSASRLAPRVAFSLHKFLFFLLTPNKCDHDRRVPEANFFASHSNAPVEQNLSETMNHIQCVSLRPRPSSSTSIRLLEKFEGLNRGDGSPANHCNGRFRVGGKSKRAPVHRSVKPYSRCRRSPMSKPRPWEKRPVTCKVRALQPPA
jgi:hypothetical protein